MYKTFKNVDNLPNSIVFIHINMAYIKGTHKVPVSFDYEENNSVRFNYIPYKNQKNLFIKLSNKNNTKKFSTFDNDK